MNYLDKLLSTYTGVMTVILTLGGLMTITQSSPLMLLAILPLTAYMIVQGVKTLYALKYGPKRNPHSRQTSTISILKSQQLARSSITSQASLRYFFAQSGKGFLVTLALLTITITSIIIKKQLATNTLISPIPQQ